MERISIWMGALASPAMLSVLPAEALKLTIATPVLQAINKSWTRVSKTQSTVLHRVVPVLLQMALIVEVTIL